MPGKGILQRKKERYHELLRQQEAKRQVEHIPGPLTPEKAFNIVTRRIDWLEDKIAFCQANNLKYDLYIREKEALLWMLDKIKELSQKLLRYES